MNIFKIKLPVIYCSDTCDWKKLLGKGLTVVAVPFNERYYISVGYFVKVKENYNGRIMVVDNHNKTYFVSDMKGWYFKPYERDEQYVDSIPGW